MISTPYSTRAAGAGGGRPVIRLSRILFCSPCQPTIPTRNGAGERAGRQPQPIDSAGTGQPAAAARNAPFCALEEVNAAGIGAANQRHHAKWSPNGYAVRSYLKLRSTPRPGRTDQALPAFWRRTQPDDRRLAFRRDISNSFVALGRLGRGHGDHRPSPARATTIRARSETKGAFTDLDPFARPSADGCCAHWTADVDVKRT